MRQSYNPNMIRNPADAHGSERYNAHSPIVMKMLGLSPTAHLPAEGLEPRELQGWTVYVRPLPPRPAGERFKRCAHRVRAICPTCKRDISAGRTHQHKCKSGKA